MAYVQKNTSRKTGKVLNYKWTALLGRDENNKQVRLTKRVEPYGMTPAAEMKQMQHDADDWERQARAEYEKQRGTSAEEKIRARKQKEKITLVSFIEDIWIPKHVKDGKHTPDTIAFYTNMSNDIKSYFKEASPGIKLSQIDKEDVLDYLAYMRNTAKTKRGTPYGATTIQHHYSTLRNIMEYAVYIEYIKEDPCKKIKPADRPKRDEHEINFLDEDEVVRFLSCLDSDEEKAYWQKNNGSHLFWKTMVNTLILTGLRRGELVGLQWGDLDKKNMLFHIRRNVTIDTSNKSADDPEKKIHIGETKGKTIRKSPLSKYVLNLLSEYKAEQEAKFGAALLPNAYIFCRSDNPYLPLYPTEPTRLMSKYIKRYNLPNMSPHDLRHTAGYLAIESGASVKEIQALLGHKDPAVSLRFYVGITEKAQRKTIEGIESLMRPERKKDANNG